MFKSNITFAHCCYCQWEDCRPGIPQGECHACWRQRTVEDIDLHC